MQHWIKQKQHKKREGCTKENKPYHTSISFPLLMLELIINSLPSVVWMLCKMTSLVKKNKKKEIKKGNINL